MSGVQGFINQRHQVQPASPRQTLGNQLRVIVAPTKLTRNNSKPPTSRPAHGAASGGPAARQDLHLPNSSSEISNGHADDFDTDAEGLEDTTITSIGDDSRTRPSIMQDSSNLANGLAHFQNHRINPGLLASRRDGQEQRPTSQRLNQLEAEDLTLEDGDESYDLNGTEEVEESVEDSEDGNGEDYVDRPESLDAQIMEEITNHGISEDGQTECTASKQAMYGPIITSPSWGNRARGRPPNASQKPVNGFDLLCNSIPADSEINRGRKAQVPKTSKESVASVPSKTPNGKDSESRRRWRQSSATRAYQPSSVIEAQLSQDGLANDLGTTNGSIMVNTDSSGRKTSPSGLHKQALGVNGPVDKTHTSIENGDKAASITHGRYYPHFSSQQDESINELDDRESIASSEVIGSRKRARDLDHSLDQLSGMTFEQLKTEPFEHNPGAIEPVLPQEIANGTLAQQLDYMFKLKEDRRKEHQRRAFFSSMPIEQYEECGDLILERFAGVIAQFKDARQQRRRAIMEFEEEVAKREERVRGKMDLVEKDLGRLKRGGEEVVRGKVGSS